MNEKSKNFHHNIPRPPDQLSLMGKEALLSTDSSVSLSGGTEQSHRNPRDHRSNFSKAHRTMFRTGTTPGEHLLPCKSWLFPLVSHSSYRS